MEQREKLIELIIESVRGCARNWAEVIADYLLANGVTVPQCKEQATKTNIEKALDYFKYELLRLIDYFGDEKHPEKIEAVQMAIEAIKKEKPQQPIAEGLADQRCPLCQSWIPFDRLNGVIENAPKRCVECGQRLDWGTDSKERKDQSGVFL